MSITNNRIGDISDVEKARKYVDRFADSGLRLTHGDWEEHKYIAKVKIRGDYWRYFYDEEEYANFLKSEREEDSIRGMPVVDNILSFFSNAGKAIGGFFSSAWDNLTATAGKVASFLNDVVAKPISSFSQQTISKGQQFVMSLIEGDSSEPKEHKYVARITTASGEYRYFYSEEEYQRYLKRQEYQENEPDFMEDVPEYDDEMSMSENMEEVNPNFPYGEGYNMNGSSEDTTSALYKEMRDRGYDPENVSDQRAYMTKYYPYAVNCSLCTLTYELRERGYDVEAKPNGYIDDDYRYHDGYHTDVSWISTVYENPKSKSYGVSWYDDKTISSDKNDILDDISKEPVGSRGEIAVFWTGGGGHSVAYTVEENHKITVRDTQTNDVYSLQDLLEVSDYIRYTRTDNLELSEECLRYVEYDD